MLKRRSTLIFFVCFLLSSILWIFNTLSKKTVKTITQEINIIDIPPNLILDSLYQKTIEIQIEGYGFEMFQLFFNTEKFNIQYQRYIWYRYASKSYAERLLACTTTFVVPVQLIKKRCYIKHLALYH